MTDQQPEALRIAERLEKVRLTGVEEECWQAAAELRRLAAVEAERDALVNLVVRAVSRIEIEHEDGGSILAGWLQDARAVIAKAEGGNDE